jgi:hypothetical protein
MIPAFTLSLHSLLVVLMLIMVASGGSSFFSNRMPMTACVAFLLARAWATRLADDEWTLQ